MTCQSPATDDLDQGSFEANEFVDALVSDAYSSIIIEGFD
jgi:hypothetical protein